MQAVRWYRDPLLAIANSRAAVIGALTATVLVFAAVFTALEQSNPHLAGHAKAGFWVACYWAITTMTTTGYGDVSPTTLPGEFLASCLMLWSCFFLLPVVVAHVIQRLLHNPDAWTDEEQRALLADVAEIKAYLQPEDVGSSWDKAWGLPIHTTPTVPPGSVLIVNNETLDKLRPPPGPIDAPRPPNHRPVA